MYSTFIHCLFEFNIFLSIFSIRDSLVPLFIIQFHGDRQQPPQQNGGWRGGGHVSRTIIPKFYTESLKWA